MYAKALRWLLLSLVVAGIVASLWRMRQGAMADATLPGLASAPTSAPASQASGKLIVYYFHGNTRCTTCNKIERLTQTTLERDFAEALRSGNILWLVVNTDEPQNAHFTKDFELSFSSVVLAKPGSAPGPWWKNLPQVWELHGDETKFRDYVREEVKAALVE